MARRTGEWPPRGAFYDAGPSTRDARRLDSLRRIDAAVVAVMAHDRAAILAGDRGPSIYV
jgi:hypothetical protein